MTIFSFERELVENYTTCISENVGDDNIIAYMKHLEDSNPMFKVNKFKPLVGHMVKTITN